MSSFSSDIKKRTEKSIPENKSIKKAFADINKYRTGKKRKESPESDKGKFDRLKRDGAEILPTNAFAGFFCIFSCPSDLERVASGKDQNPAPLASKHDIFLVYFFEKDTLESPKEKGAGPV